jgi:hypothetical protein
VTAIDRWPIVAVEHRGGTWVRITHASGTVADHDLSFLIGRGAFTALTAEMIPEAGIVDGGTVGWITPDGVVDYPPDALLEHAGLGCCRGSCVGWTPAHTVLVQRGDVTEGNLL